MTKTVSDISAEDLKSIFGEFDNNAKKIEKALKVSLSLRDGELLITGEKKGIEPRRLRFKINGIEE